MRVLESFGRAFLQSNHWASPECVDDLRQLLVEAAEERLPVTFRGSGKSYGDAALGANGLTIDVTGLNRLLSWDPATGIAEAEPGLTIEGLWRRTIEDGFWPAVVPGTMLPTLSGCVSANIHGKNNFREGVFGEHVLDLDLLLADGSIRRCSREENPELFHAVMGGIGLLGAITRVRLQLKRVPTGLLRVTPVTRGSLAAIFDEFEARVSQSDYLVGWIDCFARGSALGRGIIHQANYVPAAGVKDAAATFHVERQGLPSTILGVPKAWAWLFMQPLMHDRMATLTNAARYGLGIIMPESKRYVQSHVAFAFLLDYMPNWWLAYGPNGLVQHQVFVPATAARTLLPDVLRLCQNRGHVPYLGVLKRHRPDGFLMSHGLDGYSLALDFPVRPGRKESLTKLIHEIADRTLDVGGTFYFAKDGLLTAEHCRRAYGDRLEQFLALKRRVDPDGLFASDMQRRLLRENT